MFLDKVINRINNTENVYKKFTIEQAEQYIKDVLSGKFKPCNTEGELLIKENLIYAINTIMTSKFGLNPGEIIVKVRNLGGGTLAEIRDLIGDNKFWLQVDTYHFEEGRVCEILFSLLHEYGHINQTIREHKGQKVPKAIAVFWSKYHKLSLMEQLGVDLKYQKNGNEMDANRFAFKTYLEFLKKVDLKDRKNLVYLKMFKYAYAQYLHKLKRKLSADVLYVSWRLNNLRTDIDDAYSYVHMNKTLPERIYERNLLYKGADFSLAIRQAKKKVANIQNPAIVNFYKSLDSENKIEYAMSLVNGLMHDFIKEEGIEPEIIGEVIIPFGCKDIISFQVSQIESCPLVGYFALDERKISETTAPIKLVKAMEKATREAKKIIRENNGTSLSK